MTIEELFPKVQINQEDQMGEDWLTIPYEHSFLHFPKTSLTEREITLLRLMKHHTDRSSYSGNAWNRYLVQKVGESPDKYDGVQFIYLEHPQALAPDLLEIFQGMLPQLQVIVPISDTQTAFLLALEEQLEIVKIMQDILPVLETDFGMNLTIFVGNKWSELHHDDLQTYFTSEHQLFLEFVRHKRGENVLSFSELALWGLSRQVEMGRIPDRILELINGAKDLREIIQTMWESHGNLVQTAQKLYMHRNSLQYKLDKFRNVSGLNVKNLDDLALCYLLILND